MANIKVLPPNISNKIAAGEVVERPASVVKELVENAIDARSSDITVTIEAGGKSLIQVADDGIGMEKEDALLALKRHATSKLSSIDDLTLIETLGFRGEALPSIASVSKLELMTRTKDALQGTKVTVEGGTVESVKECGCSPGTRVSVRDLFYNVPARLKFLKTETTEMNHISNQVTWAALAHPTVKFKLIHDNRTLLDVRPCESIIQRIQLVYSRKFADNLLEFETENPEFQIRCFVGKPDFNKANRHYQLFFLNRRPIKSRLIGAALNEALKPITPKDRYPVVFIFIKLDPEEVDVNVHPAKTEVRFKNERSVYSQVVKTLQSCIYRHKYIPEMKSQEDKGVKGQRGKEVKGQRGKGIKGQKGEGVKRQKGQSGKWVSGQRDERTSGKGKRTTGNRQSSPKSIKKRLSKVRKTSEQIPKDTKLQLLDIGNVQLKTCLFDTYITAETEDEVYFIDQHVASERVLYERFVNQLNENGIPTQGLLLPVTIELAPAQLEVYKENAELLEEIGFDIELFGGQTILVRAVPSTLSNKLIAQTVTDLIDKLSDEENLDPDLNLQKNALITLACGSAVKAGDKLSYKEMIDLVKELSKTKLPFNCPHSRPIIAKMSRSEIEKRFNRK